ncbi:hypothetical protein LCGC14_1068600 [marine sediment metagenome]|uniref:Uncharacterized protein n=1 Tax=marine sediment metagenome TaxID=412755 RepID=A0A0F9N636_9ZZZZ
MPVLTEMGDLFAMRDGTNEGLIRDSLSTSSFPLGEDQRIAVPVQSPSPQPVVSIGLVDVSEKLVSKLQATLLLLQLQ